ncbi:MAG: glutamine-synthetase adenylyltransferase [Pseudomonadota bacterium]
MTSTALASRLTRVPRRYHAGRAEDAARLVVDMPPEMQTLATHAASTSPYLLGLLQKEAPWLVDAIEAPEAAAEDVINNAAALSGDLVGAALRQAKRRVALLTALTDLGGVWSLEQVTDTLTRFADAACQAALRAALAPLIRRGKLPGMTEDDLTDAGGMFVLAMGKMGAGELNYSSDIDLICLFDETRFARADFLEARRAFIQATRKMCATLSEITAEGYVFRTDLRLRPDPAVTPVCMAMTAAETYYESLGRTWERAAYIKARSCAGDLAAGARFLESLRPFVWRRQLDFAAIQDAHDMRLAIREHKGLGGPITLPGHNMKLGRGGIREIEFFTQTRQLISGGRDASLRVRGTCAGLERLAAKGWVAEETGAALQDHYRAHRRIEHCLQMIRDAQTHDLPTTPAGFDQLAAMLDTDRPALEAELRARLSAVHETTEGFFAPTPAPAPMPAPFDTRLTDRWPSYPALRSARGAALFSKLKPELLARLAQADKPEEALSAFDGFLSGLPAGVQLFSLLKANPQLADLLIDIVSTSPALAAHLSRNAGVLDAVIGGDFFSDWPGAVRLTAMLEDVLAAEADYESRLDATRRWAREWHFRIGVHLLRGLTDAHAAGGQYADLARAVLGALWPVVIAQFATRHGAPPGRGAVLVGMGALGAERLTASSDLDLIVIYDAPGAENSEGPRPLATRAYYARLTQAMITAMTAPMAQGRLYEVDMRLRPSGNQGPVATSLSGFESYQRQEAWVWEHLALTRAAVIAGPGDLGADVEDVRARVLAEAADKDRTLRAVAAMRARIAAAKAPAGPLDAKIGPGRLQDIELMGQAGLLIAGSAARSIPTGLAALAEAGVVTGAGAARLRAAYDQVWALQCATRLLSATPLKAADLGQAGAGFLCQTLACDAADVAALETRMGAVYASAGEVIAGALAMYEGQGEQDDQGR